MHDATIVFVVFIAVGMPISGVVGLRAYWMWLRDKLLTRLLDERKMLIEKGVTDLPPLELPETALTNAADQGPALLSGRAPAGAKGKVGTGNLTGGIILLLVGGVLIFIGGVAAENQHDPWVWWVFAGIVSCAIGLVLVQRYATARGIAYGMATSYQPGEEQAPQPLVVGREADPLRNMKAGIVLLFLAAAFVASDFLSAGMVPGVPLQLHIAIFLAAIGLPLLVIHAIAAHSERQEQPEPPDDPA